MIIDGKSTLASHSMTNILNPHLFVRLQSENERIFGRGFSTTKCIRGVLHQQSVPGHLGIQSVPVAILNIQHFVQDHHRG